MVGRPGRCSRGRRSTATTSRRAAGDVCSGIGVGVCFPALMTLAMSGATPSDAGLASGLVNTTAQVGGALGPGGARDAVHVAQQAPGSRAASRTAAALTSGYHLAFLIAAGLVAAAIVVAAVVVQSEKQAAPGTQTAGVEPAGAEAHLSPRAQGVGVDPAGAEAAYSEAV